MATLIRNSLISTRSVWVYGGHAPSTPVQASLVVRIAVGDDERHAVESGVQSILEARGEG